jgi:hypothetical protein
MVALDGKLQLIFLAIAFALSEGCALGPDYTRPSIEAPVSFRSQESTGRQASLADLPWWEVFKDPDLKDLITTALVNNYDLRMAISRIEQARAIETQAHSSIISSKYPVAGTPPLAERRPASGAYKVPHWVF